MRTAFLLFVTALCWTACAGEGQAQDRVQEEGLEALAAGPSPAPTQPLIALTSEERAWLDAHPDIVLGYTDSLEPGVIAGPNGKHTGMLVDALDQFNKRLGTRIKLRLYDIPDLLNNAKSKKVDGILALHPEYADEMGLLATETYWPEYLAVFARRGTSFKGPEDFAFIGDLMSTPAMINRFGLNNLEAVSPGSLQEHKTAMGIRNDWPELRSMIDKALDAMPAHEKAATMNKWNSVQFDCGISPHDVKKWVLLCGGSVI